MLGFEEVKHLLLELAQHQKVDVVLKIAVNSLGNSSSVALVRVWLVDQAKGCPECRHVSHCPDQKSCLHLKASYGRSIADDTIWDTVVESSFHRFPMGIRKIGKIAKEGKPAEVVEVDPSAEWIADPLWIRRERIVSFAGQPLICRDEVLGVLAIFTREKLKPDAIGMLRMVADHLAYAIANARAFEMVQKLKQQIEQENLFLRQEINEVRSFTGIIGNSPSIQHLRDLIAMVAPTDANVIIYGESGTGKEMAAREIHKHSARSTHPMIKINCSAIPNELFESEFFGHARGAFTGAVKNRIGYFQAADGGTLFLDEVGEIPLFMQSKFLRVLQEGEYHRVGEDVMRNVNVRIIAATNRDLQEEIRIGRFREDLYYRLQVFPLMMPSLRERESDIRLLTGHFLQLIGKRLNLPIPRLSDAQLQVLADHDWPGNIRELQNILERIIITSQPDQVLTELCKPSSHAERQPAEERKTSAEQILFESEIRNMEKENMQKALCRANGKIYGPGGAAALLGINPTTLISRLKKMGIYKIS